MRNARRSEANVPKYVGGVFQFVAGCSCCFNGRTSRVSNFQRQLAIAVVSSVLDASKWKRFDLMVVVVGIEACDHENLVGFTLDKASE